MTEFTKGPWMAVFDDELGAYVASTDTTYDIVCHVHEANAHLIAAAPDLYEALDAIIVDDTWGLDHPVYMKCRAALAKARGET